MCDRTLYELNLRAINTGTREGYTLHDVEVTVVAKPHTPVSSTLRPHDGELELPSELLYAPKLSIPMQCAIESLRELYTDSGDFMAKSGPFSIINGRPPPPPFMLYVVTPHKKDMDIKICAYLFTKDLVEQLKDNVVYVECYKNFNKPETAPTLPEIDFSGL